MSIPQISVIVPVYNVEQYLNKCIDSILNQTMTDFELILINDGSTDNSLKICEEYSLKDRRIKIFSIPNGGVSKARNFGIEQARSRWICFIDSDDYVKNDYLENFHIKGITDETIIYQGIELIYSKSNYSEIFFSYPNKRISIKDCNEIIKSKLLLDGCPCAKLFNRAVIGKYQIMFNTNLSLHEDHDFVWNYLLHIKKIILIDKISYIYMRRDNITLSTKRHSAEEYLLASELLTDKLNKLAIIIGLEKTKDYNYIWSRYGLYQIIEALKSINSENSELVINYAKKKKYNLIYKYSTTISKKICLIILLLSPTVISKTILERLFK